MSNNRSEYELIYWPVIPGRGEFVRLCFEYKGTPYQDTATLDPDACASTVQQYVGGTNTGDSLNPPPLAPPILRHGDFQLSQTPNILLYLGQKLGLAPDLSEDLAGYHHVNALTLTALDGLSNEPHDTHHPVAVAQYYEDQKEEALKKAKDYRESRLPKFLGYFERVLGGSASKGGEFLYSGKLSYADLVLFHCVDGVGFAFPKAIAKLKQSGKYEKVFALHERVSRLENIQRYLASERRRGYSMGVYRHYPELDDQD